MASRLRWSSVLAWRVRRQQLAKRAPRGKALSVVGRIAGLHAQLTASAELTLWARVAGVRRDDVSRALWEERSLVKTWAMRGTLHLLPAAELGLWVGAHRGLKPRYEVGSWLRHHGLEREQAEAMLPRSRPRWTGGSSRARSWPARWPGSPGSRGSTASSAAGSAIC